ncbi:hypothetical protein [Sphingobacterium sp. UBA6320]|jgi:hypothetical protein|uniref:hypothetical protein n=1 Tax=Sphingobacterium sp. UBA6320 TaxID=1947510 RepID=UPI0025DA70D8|nr:hypothetical protein [Sphingobacterium sp. UBA6320]
MDSNSTLRKYARMTAVPHVDFALRNKITVLVAESVNQLKINVYTIHNNDTSFRESKAVGLFALMYLTIGNLHENWKTAIIIQKSVQFGYPLFLRNVAQSNIERHRGSPSHPRIPYRFKDRNSFR